MSNERKLMKVFTGATKTAAESQAKRWEKSSDYSEPYVGYFYGSDGSGFGVHFSLSQDAEENTLSMTYSKANSKWQMSLGLGGNVSKVRSASTASFVNFATVETNNLSASTNIDVSFDVSFGNPPELPSNAFQGVTRLTGISGMPYGLTAIPNTCFSGCTALSAAIKCIPSTVKTIGASAFKSASLAGGITLPGDLTTIGSEAFASTKLTTIKIPDKVSSIGSGAFQSCTAMTAFSGSGATFTSITDNLFSSCGKLATVQLPSGIKTIGNSAFEDCTALTSFNISQNITSIGNDAFDNTRIKDAVLPSGLTTLGTSAFANNTSLSSLTITPGCKITVIPEDCFTLTGLKTVDLTNITGANSTIGVDAFSGIKTLTSVTLPANLVSIGESAFGSCSALTAINWGTKLTSIGDNAFDNNTAMTVVEIPDTVTSMGSGVFLNNTALTDITFPTNASFTAIPQSTCSGDYALSGVIIPNNVTLIEEDAFAVCSGLTQIDIPASITRIAGNTFYQCTELVGVRIGSGITSIGSMAFVGCLKLSKFEVNAVPKDVSEVPSLASNALDESLKSSDNFHILVPEGTKAFYDAAPNWSDFTAKIEEH